MANQVLRVVTGRRGWHVGGVGVLVVAALFAMFAPVAPASAFETYPIGTVSNFTGTLMAEPHDIALGADGNLWFTNLRNNSIGRITPGGAVTNYSGIGVSMPAKITAGPDGALWFTNFDNSSIGRITTTGAVTNYTSASISFPIGITSGPDGNIWFVSQANNSIGRITPAGTVTMYTGTGIDRPMGITLGPDGNLWFTNPGNSSIGRITPGGAVTNYSAAGTSPIYITAGADGNLWFTTGSTDSIGRITPVGVVTNFTGTGFSQPWGIEAGPDGNLWFTNRENDSIGRITPSGIVTNYEGAGVSMPSGIVTGPDENLWFANQGNNSIGRIGTKAPSPPTSPSAVIATSGDTKAFVSWTEPSDNGGSPITGYTATATPGGQTCSTAGLLGCTITGLTNGTSYLLTVKATNSAGDSLPSTTSTPVTPSACSAIAGAGPFADVDATHSFCSEIEWMSGTGVAGGYTDGSFRPTNIVSRQAMASFLFKYEGQPAVTLTSPFFADVPDTHPFYAAIQWMAESGLSTGSPQPVGKPLFKPADLVSRQALAAFLWRNAGEPPSGLASAFFSDVTAGTFFAPVQWMASTGLSTGTPNLPGKPLYKPGNSVSRQAMAAFLYRYDQL